MQRSNTLDYAKGMAIILMVIGHCYSSENIVLSLIYSFHMPFFFILSGIIYGKKVTYQENFQFRPRKAIVHLLIPYFAYETLFSVFLAFLDRNSNFFYSLGQKLISILTFKGVTATWYLSCITFVELAFMFLYRKKSQIAYVFSAILFVVGLFTASSITGYGIPISRCLIGLGFFEIGFVCGKSAGSNKMRLSVPILIALGGIYLIMVLKNGMVSLVSLKLSNPVLYILNALCGSTIVLSIAAKINTAALPDKIKHILLCYGQNTLIVLCTHMFFLEIIRLLDYKMFNNVLPRFGMGEGIIFGMILCGIEYFLIPFYHFLKKQIYSIISQGAKV